MDYDKMTHEELIEERSKKLLASIEHCHKIAQLTQQAMTKTELVIGLDVGPIHLAIDDRDATVIFTKRKVISISDRKHHKVYTLIIEDLP